MGEHAAVYGRTALVAALDLRCQVEVTALPGERLELSLPDLGVEEATAWSAVRAYADATRRRWLEHATDPVGHPFRAMRGTDRAHLVRVAAGETARVLGLEPPPGARIRVTSSIPRGSGFGSSAALAVALPAALFAAWGETPTPSRIDPVALEVERRQHGLPSGVDHATALAGGVVRARRDPAGALAVEPLALRAETLRAMRIFHTGEASESTGEVVAAVREGFAGRRAALDALLERMEAATLAFAREACRETDATEAGLRPAVREFESCLEALGVVPPQVCAIVRAFEATGGAAKISGAGSASGPGAGALLVLPSPAGDSAVPDRLPHLTPVRAQLGGPGLAVEGSA